MGGCVVTAPTRSRHWILQDELVQALLKDAPLGRLMVLRGETRLREGLPPELLGKVDERLTGFTPTAWAEWLGQRQNELLTHIRSWPMSARVSSRAERELLDLLALRDEIELARVEAHARGLEAAGRGTLLEEDQASLDRRLQRALVRCAQRASVRAEGRPGYVEGLEVRLWWWDFLLEIDAEVVDAWLLEGGPVPPEVPTDLAEALSASRDVSNFLAPVRPEAKLEAPDSDAELSEPETLEDALGGERPEGERPEGEPLETAYALPEGFTVPRLLMGALGAVAMWVLILEPACIGASRSSSGPRIRAVAECFAPAPEGGPAEGRSRKTACAPGDHVRFRVALPRGASELRIWALGPDGDLEVRMPGSTRPAFSPTAFQNGQLGRGFLFTDEDEPGKYTFELRFYGGPHDVRPLLVEHRSVTLEAPSPPSPERTELAPEEAPSDPALLKDPAPPGEASAP